MNPSALQTAGTILFALAIMHTFLAAKIHYFSQGSTTHKGLWHLLGEVEAVFAFWAFALMMFIFLTDGFGAAAASDAVFWKKPFVLFDEGISAATRYAESLNFTEPAFVFVIMVVAASRPILELCKIAARFVARLLPLPDSTAFFFVCLSLMPLLGSFITEPAAMTLAALMLRDSFYSQQISSRLKYLTIGVLFVNISIGGTLTNFAAPPVLMVAGKWNWDLAYMFTHFGWKAAIAVTINAAAVTFLFKRELRGLQIDIRTSDRTVPWLVIIGHVLLLACIVYNSHHPIAFIAFFLFFLGGANAYKQYQDELMVRQGLMVGLFLAGLVTLGAQQQWWLQPALEGMNATVLYFGATALTAITDNAALTYLGSLVEGIDETFKYMLVAGAVTGGGLTVIANAPNPAGYSILSGHFEGGSINPLKLLGAALPPTIISIIAFLLL